jgi:hypothetical protein
VTDHNDQMQKLRAIWPGAELWTEGGQPAIFLPSLEIKIRGESVVRGALLWPQAHGSYSTRLFLDAAVPAGQNWNPASVCGRSWQVCSWNGVPADMPWDEMVGSHLGAFK